MNISESITQKVQDLPREKQQEVLDFIEFLVQKTSPTDEVKAQVLSNTAHTDVSHNPSTPLGKKLKEIRNRAIASGMSLVSAEDIEQELSQERDRLSGL